MAAAKTKKNTGHAPARSSASKSAAKTTAKPAAKTASKPISAKGSASAAQKKPAAVKKVPERKTEPILPEKKTKETGKPVYDFPVFRDILAVLSFGFAVLLMISCFQKPGASLSWLQEGIFYLFGKASYIIPFLTLFSLIYLLGFPNRGKLIYRLISIILFLLAICGTANLAFFDGGWIGNSLMELMVPVFGAVGSYLILVVGLLIGLILISGKSVVDRMRKALDQFRCFMEEWREISEGNRQIEEEKRQLHREQEKSRIIVDQQRRREEIHQQRQELARQTELARVYGITDVTLEPDEEEKDGQQYSVGRVSDSIELEFGSDAEGIFPKREYRTARELEALDENDSFLKKESGTSKEAEALEREKNLPKRESGTSKEAEAPDENESISLPKIHGLNEKKESGAAGIPEELRTEAAGKEAGFDMPPSDLEPVEDKGEAGEEIHKEVKKEVKEEISGTRDFFDEESFWSGREQSETARYLSDEILKQITKPEERNTRDFNTDRSGEALQREEAESPREDQKPSDQEEADQKSPDQKPDESASDEEDPFLPAEDLFEREEPPQITVPPVNEDEVDWDEEEDDLQEEDHREASFSFEEKAKESSLYEQELPPDPDPVQLLSDRKRMSNAGPEHNTTKTVVTSTGKVITVELDGVPGERKLPKEPRSAAAAAPANVVPDYYEEPREYEFPPIELLRSGKPPEGDRTKTQKTLLDTAEKLRKTLESFGVKVTITDISCGPSVTRYELQPEQGVKVSRIVSLTDDIKLNLAAADIRMEAPIPGKAAIGIEVPNEEKQTVSLRDLLETDKFRQHKSKVVFAAGKDIAGETILADIAKMPHLLIAGATGSGKSVCINSLIMSILYKAKPSEVKMIMIDPKMVELSVYEGIPHLLLPVVTDPKKASAALNWAVGEMTRRYQKFAEYKVRDMKGYNDKVDSVLKELPEDSRKKDAIKKMPQIILIVDELADLMMVAPGEVEDAICRLAQLARAAGIHLVIATQRPSVNVITGLIKANIPSRIAFSVSSGIDSRTIIDMYGAEKLLGKGDMLFYPAGYPKPLRVQGCFVSDDEIIDVVKFLTDQKNVIGGGTDSSISLEEKDGAKPSEDKDGPEVDDYFEKAGFLVVKKEKASITLLQREFKIGFNRAARIMDQLAREGIVSEEEGTKPRKVLMTMEEFQRR